MRFAEEIIKDLKKDVTLVRIIIGTCKIGDNNLRSPTKTFTVGEITHKEASELVQKAIEDRIKKDGTKKHD